MGADKKFQVSYYTIKLRFGERTELLRERDITLRDTPQIGGLVFVDEEWRKIITIRYLSDQTCLVLEDNIIKEGI